MNRKTKQKNTGKQKFYLFCLTMLLGGLLQSAGLNAQNEVKKNISLRDVTVNELVKKLGRVYPSSFFIADQEVAGTVVSVNVKNATVEQTLASAFTGKNLSYTKAGENFTIVRRAAATPDATQQPATRKTLSGTVVDQSGEPLIGASVQEKGTNNGTITDADGRFSLAVAEGATLQVSYIGYIAQEIATLPADGIVRLAEDTQALEEVVGIGYGTQKKVNLTGSISTMKTEEIATVPASNLSNALAGRLAGVTVTQSDGGRPGNSSAIKIRAAGTWNNSDPLYVIDGVTRDKFAFDGLDAGDIENISVLKDGASAAIYGSRSANGVVLVTTKRGKEGKPTINYTGTVGVSSPTQYTKMQNAYDQATIINDHFVTMKLDPTDARFVTAEELEYFRNNSTDWIREAWQNPTVSHHALNVAGGTDRVRYFLGGAYYYETGAFNNMTFDRYSLRANLEANITRDLIVGLDLNTDVRNDLKPYWANDQGSDSMYDYFGMATLYGPAMRPAFIDGLPVANDMSMNFMMLSSEEFGYVNRRYANTEASITLRYDVPPVPGLSLKFLYNNYFRHQFTKEHVYPFTWYEFEPTRPGGYVLSNTVRSEKTYSSNGNFIKERYDANRNYQINGYINYDRTFGKHDLSAVLIYEASEGYGDWFRGEVRNFASNLVEQLGAGSQDVNDRSVDGSGSETGRESYAGRIHYGYDNRYMLELSARYDGSVIFSPEKRWGFFPSGSAAWRISEESFFKDNVSFVSSLKLRGSVALLGNDQIGGWQWRQAYSLTSGAQYGTGVIGVEPGVVPNVDITWEKSLAWNGGIDAGFLKNRLTVGFDVFNKHTYDILGQRLNSLPSTSGLKLAAENYGVVDSHGFELEAGYVESLTKDLDLRLGANLGYAVNKLILKDEAENLPAYRSELGYNTDRARGFIYDDILRTQADLDALPEGYTIRGATPELGMINYKDIRGVNSDTPDGKITDEDQDWIINHATPPVTYGFMLGAGWKGFDLDLFFQGVAGNDLTVKYRDMNYRVAKTNPHFWTDHWTPENIDARYPRAEASGTSNGYPESTFWRRNGSFLRLRNVTLSYTFPQRFLSALKVSQLKIFYTGNNLFLLEDHVKDFDPELGNIDDNSRRYPIMKSSSFGINLSF